jgi:hypothetical protein
LTRQKYVESGESPDKTKSVDVIPDESRSIVANELLFETCRWYVSAPAAGFHVNNIPNGWLDARFVGDVSTGAPGNGGTVANRRATVNAL